MPTTLRAKLVIVGDSTVGKSAVTQVFHSDGTHFPKNYNMTTGVELVTKTVTIPEAHDQVELYLYDSAGKELFSEIVQKYWSNPSMIMVVYDVTNESSFNSCAKWLERVRSQKPEVQMPGKPVECLKDLSQDIINHLGVLVGNKIDLDQRRRITPKMGRDFAESNGLEYFECSAKEMQNIDQPFHYLANAYHKLYREKLEMFKGLA